ncbi:putative trans-resveratrol di-O-methyltransferase [Helianthus anomalus]
MKREEKAIYEFMLLGYLMEEPLSIRPFLLTVLNPIRVDPWQHTCKWSQNHDVTPWQHTSMGRHLELVLAQYN